jgi:hypothetical protein
LVLTLCLSWLLRATTKLSASNVDLWYKFLSRVFRLFCSMNGSLLCILQEYVSAITCVGWSTVHSDATGQAGTTAVRTRIVLKIQSKRSFHPLPFCSDEDCSCEEPSAEGMLKKKKAIPLQALTFPWGFRRLRLPEFLDNRHLKVVRLSALRTGRL